MKAHEDREPSSIEKLQWKASGMYSHKSLISDTAFHHFILKLCAFLFLIVLINKTEREGIIVKWNIYQPIYLTLSFNTERWWPAHPSIKDFM